MPAPSFAMHLGCTTAQAGNDLASALSTASRGIVRAACRPALVAIFLISPHPNLGGGRAVGLGAALACAILASSKSKATGGTQYHLSVLACLGHLYHGLASRIQELQTPLQETADAALKTATAASVAACTTLKSVGSAPVVVEAGEKAKAIGALATTTASDAAATCVTAASQAAEVAASAAHTAVTTLASAVDSSRPLATTVRATMGGAVLAASSFAKTSFAACTTSASALKALIGPTEVAATALLCVSAVTMKRSRELRKSRDEMIMRIAAAEAALNATRPEITLLKTRLVTAESASNKVSVHACTLHALPLLRERSRCTRARLHASSP